MFILHTQSSHLGDLKMLTEDVLYETYRTEKLSRSVDSNIRDSQILPQELATQGVRIKEEQLRREEEKVLDFSLNIQIWYFVDVRWNSSSKLAA